MKKTYYLFNPGQLERKDNTLKFTPVVEDGNGEVSGHRDTYLSRILMSFMFSVLCELIVRYLIF